MSCAIVSGVSNVCRDSIGGIKYVLITETANIASTTSASGNISAMSLNAGKVFYRFDMTQATGNYNQTTKPNLANGSYYVEQTVNFKIPKFTATIAYQIKNLGQQPVSIIVYTMNGDFILLGGTNGMNMTDSTQGSGTAMADFSGFDLNFMAQESDLALTVDSAVVATLI